MHFPQYVRGKLKDKYGTNNECLRAGLNAGLYKVVCIQLARPIFSAVYSAR